MKLNQLKAATFQATGLSSIKQIKATYPQFANMNFSKKATWSLVFDYAKAYQANEPEFHQEDIDAVIDAITIPASAIACELPEPTPQDGNELIAALASYQPAAQPRKQLAAQRIAKQLRNRRWRADRTRGFAAV